MDVSCVAACPMGTYVENHVCVKLCDTANGFIEVNEACVCAPNKVAAGGICCPTATPYSEWTTDNGVLKLKCFATCPDDRSNP